MQSAGVASLMAQQYRPADCCCPPNHSAHQPGTPIGFQPEDFQLQALSSRISRQGLGSHPDLGHGSSAQDPAECNLTVAVGTVPGKRQKLLLKRFLWCPTTHLAPLPLTNISKENSFIITLILASHVPVILYTCPWLLYILATSNANSASLVSCLVPRQYVAQPSLCSQLSFGYLILTAPNMLVIFLKGDTL